MPAEVEVQPKSSEPAATTDRDRLCRIEIDKIDIEPFGGEIAFFLGDEGGSDIGRFKRADLDRLGIGDRSRDQNVAPVTTAPVSSVTIPDFTVIMTFSLHDDLLSAIIPEQSGEGKHGAAGDLSEVAAWIACVLRLRSG